MEKRTAVALAMTDYMKGDVKRINHFLKVHAYALIIAEGEGFSEEEKEILEVAAYTHDIGIRLAEEKYHSAAGIWQQKEGPAEAEKLLAPLGYPRAVTDRVKYLIAHHHEYGNIEGRDFRALVEADFLVNADEDKLSKEAILRGKEKIFRTKTGKKLLSDLFGV